MPVGFRIVLRQLCPPVLAVPIAITPVSIGGAGYCPAPHVVNVAGRSLSLSYQPVCTFAAMVKPIVLAFAWFGAAMIFVGGIKNG